MSKECVRCDYDGVTCEEDVHSPQSHFVIHHTTPEVRRKIAGEIKSCPIAKLDIRFGQQLKAIKKEFLK